MHTFAGCVSMIDFSAGTRVYFDTNIFIYYVEKTPEFFEQACTLIDQVVASGAELVASALTHAECLYQPCRDNDRKLARIYDRLFASGDIDVTPVDGALLQAAARHGGALGLKLLDAMHYLAALNAGCRFFVTSDARFRSGPKMSVIVLKP